MGAWNDFADRFGTDKALSDLDGEQIKAVVDLLLLVMYADDKASVLEEMELEEQLCKLPAISGKKALVDAHVAAATARIRGADGSEVRTIARGAAEKLPSTARGLVLQMAAAMAYADIQLAADESATLGLIAEALGFDASAARAALAQQS